MEEKILELLAGLKPECDFENSEGYIEEGLLDSLDIIAIVEYVEEEYGIKIPGTEISLKNFNTLEGIVSLIEKVK